MYDQTLGETGTGNFEAPNRLQEWYDSNRDMFSDEVLSIYQETLNNFRQTMKGLELADDDAEIVNGVIRVHYVDRVLDLDDAGFECGIEARITDSTIVGRLMDLRNKLERTSIFRSKKRSRIQAEIDDLIVEGLEVADSYHIEISRDLNNFEDDVLETEVESPDYRRNRAAVAFETSLSNLSVINANIGVQTITAMREKALVEAKNASKKIAGLASFIRTSTPILES